MEHDERTKRQIASYDQEILEAVYDLAEREVLHNLALHNCHRMGAAAVLKRLILVGDYAQGLESGAYVLNDSGDVIPADEVEDPEAKGCEAYHAAKDEAA